MDPLIQQLVITISQSFVALLLPSPDRLDIGTVDLLLYGFSDRNNNTCDCMVKLCRDRGLVLFHICHTPLVVLVVVAAAAVVVVDHYYNMLTTSMTSSRWEA